jgi:voltage-gated potassium channel
MERQRAELFDRVNRATEVPMLLFALIFAAILMLLTLGDLPSDVDQTLEAVTWLIWGIFAFELLVKTFLAPHRRRYLFTHWADVLTVILPALRPLRLLRLLVAGARFWRDAEEVLKHRTFSLLAVTSLCAGIGAGVLVYMAERQGDGPIQTLPDALWWAASTITTVGYGDVYPRTAAGRGIAVVLMLVGISLFGVLTARVAAFFVQDEQRDAEANKLDDIRVRLQRVEELLEQQRTAGSNNHFMLPPLQRRARSSHPTRGTSVGQQRHDAQATDTPTRY